MSGIDRVGIENGDLVSPRLVRRCVPLRAHQRKRHGECDGLGINRLRYDPRDMSRQAPRPRRRWLAGTHACFEILNSQRR
jgi:hypothetical protein